MGDPISAVATALTPGLQALLTVVLVVWVWRLDRRLAVISERLDQLVDRNSAVDSRRRIRDPAAM